MIFLRAGSPWVLEFVPVSHSQVRVMVQRGGKVIQSIECTADNQLTSNVRVVLNRQKVELPMGELVQSDFTMLPGMAVVRVGRSVIRIQENGITVAESK